MIKFVNDRKQFVPEMLKGIALVKPAELRYVPEYNLIMRSDSPSDRKVSIVQGSGSGHEPGHVVLVGKGMLGAACPGDVTVKHSTPTVGRRGVAGNFFVMKAVGAAAECGADLDSLVALGKRVNSVTRTMGIALSSCTPPAKGSPLFQIAEDEMEVGVGIHGEPGRRRAKQVTANEVVALLMDAVAPDLPFVSGDRVALMINGLGGTPISELYLLYGIAHQRLAAQGIKVARSYVGEYCTSLDMAGASLTLVKLDDELMSLLLAPAVIPYRDRKST